MRCVIKLGNMMNAVTYGADRDTGEEPSTEPQCDAALSNPQPPTWLEVKHLHNLSLL